jgi:hypothetical protein
MHIPIAHKSPAEFTQDVAEALQLSETHLYIDTSFLMWLTTAGQETRQQFKTWAAEYPGRIHVPLWTKHEYYRHHASGTLRSRLNRLSDELNLALKVFKLELSRYADNVLIPGHPEGALQDAIDDVATRVREITDGAKSWNYEEAANDIIGWMNDRTMPTATPFQSMDSLGEVGAVRYSHDVPPGFLDRRKKDRPKRGSNRFGDLLFWQEVMEHAKSDTVKKVIVVTRDRKHDWFLKTSRPEVEDEWKRLRDKWEPVPHPHPTLAFELKVVAGADLVLLDELYLGAYLWRHRRPEFARLAAMAIDVDPEKFKTSEKTRRLASKRALKRTEPTAVSMGRAMGIMKAAIAAPDGPTQAILDMLGVEANKVEEFVDRVGPASFVGLNLEQVACCCRVMHDQAAAEPGPARSALTNLLDRLDEFRAEVAAAAYAGILMSIYFDGQSPRAMPRSPLLQDVFDWQGDSALQFVLKALSFKLRKVNSAVLYIPTAGVPPAEVLFTADLDQQQSPAILDQVYYANEALLANGTLLQALLLRPAVGGDEATLDRIADAVAVHFGLPLEQLVIKGGEGGDLRSIPEHLGFREFDRFSSDDLPEEEDIPPPGDEDELPEHDEDDLNDEEDDE